MKRVFLGIFTEIKMFIKTVLSYQHKGDRHAYLEDLESFVDEGAMLTKSDVNGNITYVNTKFEKITGLSSKDVIGRNHMYYNFGINNKLTNEKVYDILVNRRKIISGVFFK